jgi:hypothetical protein
MRSRAVVAQALAKIGPRKKVTGIIGKYFSKTQTTLNLRQEKY